MSIPNLQHCWVELGPLVESGAATSGVLLVIEPGKSPDYRFAIESDEHLPAVISSLEEVVRALKGVYNRRETPHRNKS